MYIYILIEYYNNKLIFSYKFYVDKPCENLTTHILILRFKNKKEKGLSNNRKAIDMQKAKDILTSFIIC